MEKTGGESKDRKFIMNIIYNSYQRFYRLLKGFFFDFLLLFKKFIRMVLDQIQSGGYDDY